MVTENMEPDSSRGNRQATASEYLSAHQTKVCIEDATKTEGEAREVVECPSLETLKTGLDTALKNLTYVQSQPCFG